MTPGSYFRSDAVSGTSASANVSFDIGSVDLVRKFVEHVTAKDASAVQGHGRSPRSDFDWELVTANVAGSRSFEHAIGRAVVIADQMRRGMFDDTHLDASDDTHLGAASSLRTDDPFFAFSMADVIPDFGDESRYRTRLARKASKILRTRRTVVPVAVSLLLALLFAGVH